MMYLVADGSTREYVWELANVLRLRHNRVCHQVALRAGVNLFCTEFQVDSESGFRFDLGGQRSEHKHSLL